MVSAAVAEVPVGSTLCRITQSALPAEVSLTSPWWAYKADFALILSRSLATSADFRDFLRDNLALAGDYTIPNDRAEWIRTKYGRDALVTLKNYAGIRPYDRIIEIETLSPLLAFTGIGRDVVDTHPDSALGALKTWTAATDIRQLFIPGLQDSDRRLSAVGRAGMHYRRSLNLSHWIDRQIDAVDGTAFRLNADVIGAKGLVNTLARYVIRAGLRARLPLPRRRALLEKRSPAQPEEIATINRRASPPPCDRLRAGNGPSSPTRRAPVPAPDPCPSTASAGKPVWSATDAACSSPPGARPWPSSPPATYRRAPPG